ncbi:efflux RND transporter permease subunit [Chromobacterium rhizoryzae]|uniref:Efflux RND transporter permease subunit n=1 Tax=Chromobacterium rhizoryzae TaxID=1778675 RepID=A0AAD0WAD8_9NEIS|nr:efflux RND transporter permease subunit [Chromobacterium rhizoryzae]AXT48431.1 efflux RND transporter permease subunit [Chromobacterium rhizoryzae]
MQISELCIRRPVMTVLLCLSLVVAGLIAYQKLPIAALPSFDTPTINVSASLPGASPDSMASSVAAPLEKQFSTIPGIAVISSSSTLGSTSITLEFDNDRNIDLAAVDVQAALLRAQRSLPTEMTSMPSYRKVNPADSPVLLLALNSPAMSLSDLNDYAENWISPNIATLKGVAQVNIFGQKRFAVRIKADPGKLASRNLTLDDVAASIRAANVNTPVGTLEGKSQLMTVEANRQLQNAAQFANLVIASRNGLPVRLSDVASVEDSVENLKTGSWVNGERSIVLAVMRQSDANTVAVVDAIRKELPQLQAQLPGSVRLNLLNDRSQSIREAIHDVKLTLLLTIALVIMVIFMFLQRMAATVIPALSLPISLIGTIGLMYWLGYSLDNISLLGITLAVGLVVDDAIVMLENIVRYIEEGLSTMEAALRGSREIAFTIVSISLSLVAIFIPIFFMQGVIGLLFHEFAVVVSLAVLVSAAVSLTLIPLLSSRFLRADSVGHQARRGRLAAALEGGFDAVLAGYRRTLDLALKHRRLTLAGALSTFVLTALMFNGIPKGFFPTEDTGQIMASTEAAQDISYDAMLKLQQRAAAITQANPNVAFATSSLSGGNTGRMFIQLKPRGERAKLDPTMESLRRDLRAVPGLSVYLNPTQNLRLGGRQSKSRYQYTLQGIQAESLNTWSDKLLQQMQVDPIFRDVTSDSQLKGLQAKLNIDRDKANLLGVDIQSIRSALYSAFGERQISTIYTPSDNYQVILQADDPFKVNEFDLSRLRVRAADGQLVQLSSIASVERTVGPISVNHQGQLQAVTLSFNLAPGIPLSQADQHLRQLKERIALPASIATSYSGDAAAFEETQGSQILLLGIAVAVIYVLLGVLYESYIHPLTILSGLPSAAIGALGTLMLFGQELTVIASIGILMLIGIVKKNAIMMIDFALEAQRKQGMSPEQAIHTACLLRFRPIMMTTLAALMGALPIALGLGAGAELRQPLGLAVVGGLVFSQVVTLYITPVLYLYFDALAQRHAAWREKRRALRA